MQWCKGDCKSHACLKPIKCINISLCMQKMSFACQFDGCEKAFTSKWSLKRHMRTHTGDKPFKCSFPDCEMSFVEKCALKRHEASHSLDHPHVCEYPGCGRRFKLKEYLVVHERVHQKDASTENPTAVSTEYRDDTLMRQLRERIVHICRRHGEETETLYSRIREQHTQIQSLNSAVTTLKQIADGAGIEIPSSVLNVLSVSSAMQRVDAESEFSRISAQGFKQEASTEDWEQASDSRTTSSCSDSSFYFSHVTDLGEDPLDEWAQELMEPPAIMQSPPQKRHRGTC